MLLIHSISLDAIVAFILPSFYSCYTYIHMHYIDMHLIPAVFYSFSPFIHFKATLRFFYCLLKELRHQTTHYHKIHKNTYVSIAKDKN